MHMNYSQIMSPLPRKVGVMTPSSYGSAAPAFVVCDIDVTMTMNVIL